MKQLLCITLLISLSLPAMAQKQYTEFTLRPKLDSLSVKYPGYNNAVQLNVSGLPLAELVNSLALENNLNISIDPSFNQAISYNFFDAQVKDVLVFLYENFDVEYQFVGSILAIKKPMVKKEVPLPKVEKKMDVTYNPSNEFLSVDLKNDSLYKVVQAITTLSGKNIVLAPEVRDKPVSAYFLNRPFDQVFDMIAKANGLESKKDENGFYYLFTAPKSAGNNGNTFNPSVSSFEKTGVQITKNGFGTLDIVANNAELMDIIRLSAQECGAHYFLYNKPEGKSSFEVYNTTFPQLLEFLFNGTKYAYREDTENNVFLVGENKIEGIRVTELIRMENRTIENVKASIPKDLISDLDVNEFLELNGLVVTGSSRKISELKAFLSSIDVVVPMVQIDVMFITSNRNNTVSSGLKAGLGDKPATTTGSVFPAVDVTLGAQTINAILDGINGFGVFNLGNVTENFYLSMSLLESNGTVEIESTPKIATLSGHSANISIGQTTYYQETQVDVQNSVVNQGVLTSKIWKSIDANLTVKIKPFVSADEYVTLAITVTNDDFEARTDITAPPGTTKQTFESVVRVKNGEVVLLGGLEKKRKSNTGEGVPFISRVPVLKWFFSSRERTSEKNKMHIIIRPTITY